MTDATAVENAPTPSEFDGRPLARQLLRTVRSGSLATLDAETGAPFVSLVSVATDRDGAPLLLLSRLSAHTGHLDHDPRAALLLSRGGRGDPMAHPRLSVLGRIEPAPEPHVRGRFLRRHPKAELYVDFPDFAFRRLVPERAHLNGGFARAASLDAASFLTDLDGAAALGDAEERALDHMNADHLDAIALYATRLAKVGADGRDAAWRATGFDPDGMDLAAGDLTARVLFPERVADAGALRRVLVTLAEQARAVADDAGGEAPRSTASGD